MKALRMTGKAVGLIVKVLFVGLLLIGHFVMNCVGALICAISSN